MKFSNNKTLLFIIFGGFLVFGVGMFLIPQLPQIDSKGEIVSIVIPDGLRKEQTADILAEALGWNTEQETKFVVKDTARNFTHIEGVLPGGTYNLSTASSTYEIASVLLRIADDRYQEFGDSLTLEEWYEVLKVAAIVEREAVSSDQMESIAKDVWQKRRDNILLQSEATVQYVRDTMQNYPNESCWGDKDTVINGMVKYSPLTNKETSEKTGCIHWRLVYGGAENEYEWWVPVTEEDRKLPHGYNTYLYKGLPQHPIATPSREAIVATINTR